MTLHSQATDYVRLSICVCTSGRPVELRRCLASIAAGTRRPAEVVVSDDCRDPGAAAAVKAACDAYDFVRLVQGPRRGLCANRNHVVRQATGTHLSLLDDDAVVSPEFVERGEALIVVYPNTILTGDVLEDGTRRTSPTNPTFLGHFGRPVRPGEPLENVNLNCNLFPRRAFEAASFDESIAYGYEDADLCAHLAAKGYAFAYTANLVNEHRPPHVSVGVLDARRRLAERARLRVLWRRWAVHRRRPIIGLLAMAAAVPHLAIHEILRRAKFTPLP